MHPALAKVAMLLLKEDVQSQQEYPRSALLMENSKAAVSLCGKLIAYALSDSYSTHDIHRHVQQLAVRHHA